MKKLLTLFLCLFIFFSFVGCNSKTHFTQSKKVKIATTNFSCYDWTKNLIEKTNNIEISLISNGSVDMHSFNPSTDDILNISSADAFIYIGGVSDSWTTKILKNSINKNLTSLALLETITESEVNKKDSDHLHKEDEHIWLSLKNAKLCIKEILNLLVKLDPENKDTFNLNYENYLKSLNQLDQNFTNTLQYCKRSTIIFGDRFPFYYLFNDYSLTHFAAFDGCEAESEADFETITGLAKKIDELNLSYVLVNDNQNLKIAQTIINNTKAKNQKILSLNSMQSTNENSNSSYLKIMEENLKILNTALSKHE